MSRLTFPKPVPTALAVGLALLIWFVIPVPDQVTPEAWHMLALFTGSIAAIIGKALPIGAVSMVAIALVAITEVTRPGNPEGALADALSGFSNPLIWLIGIAVMIAVALVKTGLGTRIGYHFIALFGRKTIGIAYGLVLSELVIAPVTPSNTARGGAIIHPIMRSIADGFGSSPELGTQNRMGRYLALVNYNANPITSAMFVTATAPNPLIVALIAKATNPSLSITWGQWALAALLPCLCMLVLMPLVLYVLFPPEVRDTPDAKGMAEARLNTMGPMSTAEFVTLGVLALMLLMWAGVPAMLLGPAAELNATTTAMVGLSLLLLTGVLEWEDILKARSAWDTLIWFAALVMMATFLGKLGLVGWFSLSIQNAINYLNLGWVSATILLVLVYFYSHYFFASTTAHITAMFGAFFAAGTALGAPPAPLALLLAFASSLMMSLTHYGTGTAPIIFGSGYTTLNEWWAAGAVMSVVNLLILVGVGAIWWKLLGYI
ncbi:DASS family divalent anion:Na+ symporter [Plasticicumulans lactativorans]|uniref:DASS family divalent anion:Na+ symporter n=1 Tax=Plasticicumulans lactativorans TaxID=1133106 RepID=A0A4R2L3Y7_9GAMM|nr:DASS family sodium-coupled anion symporter [Plasticicumulans lactativorans]TCO81267.1 DASS family divalent anion:Na+ symporter [Plasticicumulans lactativorans]